MELLTTSEVKIEQEGRRKCKKNEEGGGGGFEFSSNGNGKMETQSIVNVLISFLFVQVKKKTGGKCNRRGILIDEYSKRGGNDK